MLHKGQHGEQAGLASCWLWTGEALQANFAACAQYHYPFPLAEAHAEEAATNTARPSALAPGAWLCCISKAEQALGAGTEPPAESAEWALSCLCSC